MFCFRKSQPHNQRTRAAVGGCAGSGSEEAGGAVPSNFSYNVADDVESSDDEVDETLRGAAAEAPI